MRATSSPVHTRHLHIEDGKIGFQFSDEFESYITPTGFTDDFVTFFFEGFTKVKTNNGFVFSNHHSNTHACI